MPEEPKKGQLFSSLVVQITPDGPHVIGIPMNGEPEKPENN